MKPSEQFLYDLQRVRTLGRTEPDVDVFCGSVAVYLDKEAERRAAFEQDITERVWALEAAAGKGAIPLCADGRPVHDFQGQPACPDCGWVLKVARIGDLVSSGGPGQQVELKGSK